MGVPPKRGMGLAITENVWSIITCGPCAMLIFGIIGGILLGMIWTPLAYAGMAIGATLAILVVIGNANRTPCPACKRGHVVPVTSERGQAMLERNQILYGSDQNHRP